MGKFFHLLFSTPRFGIAKGEIMKPTISILSERVNREDRITRLSGKIRPGIMVLTKAAQKNEKAV